MRALTVRLRSELRRGWRSWTGLVLLVGVLSAVILATVAGARRTDTAFPRLLSRSNAADYLVSASTNGVAGGFYDDVARLPDVATAGTAAGTVLFVPAASAEVGFVDALISLDGRYGYTINRPKVTAGRLPSPGRADEVLANRPAADLLGLRVGSKVEALAPRTADSGPDDSTPVALTVVGIGLYPNQVVPSSPLESGPQLYLTPAYGRERAGDERGYDGVAVRLAAGADRDAFRRQVEQLADRHRAVVGDELFIGEEVELHAKTVRAIRPQSLALAAFAALAGAAALLVIGQTFSRQLSRDSVDYPLLRVLGMSRGQVVALALARAALVGVLGAALGVVLAVASSPLMPIGPARVAEPSPGISADLAVLVPGSITIVVLLVAWAAVPALRAASADARVTAARRAVAGRSPLARVLSQVALPPTAAAGARMALDPAWGPPSVPVRSTLAGTAVALAAVTGAVTFGANLQRLVSTPSLYGRSWDLAVDSGFGAIPVEDAARVLRSDPAVSSFSGGNYGEVTIDGRAIPAVGIDPLQGDAFPTLLEGRAPARDDEIVLGTTSLRELGRGVGDTVEVQRPDGRSTMRIVGRAVFPKLGRGSFPPTGLGQGAAVTASLFRPLEAPADTPAYGFFLVRFYEGADANTARRVAERLQRDLCGPVDFCYVGLDQRPADISNYADVRRTPLVLAGLLIVLAVATLGHALSTSVRRRRRDLAVFRAIGFVRRQVSSTVAWQATAVATVAAVIGVPLGVAAGRLAWRAFADQLGIAPEAIVPLLAVLAALPAAVVVANVVAAVPGRMAGRAHPAAVLRTE